MPCQLRDLAGEQQKSIRVCRYLLNSLPSAQVLTCRQCMSLTPAIKTCTLFVHNLGRMAMLRSAGTYRSDSQAVICLHLCMTLAECQAQRGKAQTPSARILHGLEAY